MREALRIHLLNPDAQIFHCDIDGPEIGGAIDEIDVPMRPGFTKAQKLLRPAAKEVALDAVGAESREDLEDRLGAAGQCGELSWLVMMASLPAT
jgi:hypothetical protein